MANPKPSASLTKETRKRMPPRGKNKRTLILEAIKEKGLLGLHTGASTEDAEKAIFSHMSQIAFMPEEGQESMASACLSHLMNKGWASLKPQDPCVEFEFDSKAKPYEQSLQIMQAVSDGLLSPSVAVSLINALTGIMKIQEVTDLDERLSALEVVADEQI